MRSLFLARLVAMNDGWAKPFGEFNHRWVVALFRPIRPVKDFLNGTWLGHPVHPAVTDIPIGAFARGHRARPVGRADGRVLGDRRRPARCSLASAVTGLADYATRTARPGPGRRSHGTIMVVGCTLDSASRSSFATTAPAPRGGLAIGLLVVGFLVCTAGAYIGGDLVFVFGNMVSRHAFRGAGTKWIALDTGDVSDLATLPEATPTKMRAGINDLVVVRIGDDDPCPACRVRPCRRATGRGHRHARRLPRVPLARVAIPAERTGAAPAARRSTTSPRTRSERRWRRLRGPARRAVDGEGPDSRRRRGRRSARGSPARCDRLRRLARRRSSPTGAWMRAVGTPASSGIQRRT